jgi:DNA-binding PadR family transcriptional regulator
MFGRHLHEEFGPLAHARFFEKGALKYVILDLIKYKPSHGYEIMRALEERFHGFYSPSAGSIYPTLQLMEDQGYVKSTEQDGKKVYTITEEGLKFLAEREETVDKIKEHMHGWWGHVKIGGELRETMQDLGEIRNCIIKAVHNRDTEKVRRIKEIIAKACGDIQEVIKS